MDDKQIEGWVYVFFQAAGVKPEDIEIIPYHVALGSASEKTLGDALTQARDEEFDAVVVSESVGRVHWSTAIYFGMCHDIPMLLKREGTETLHLTQVVFGPTICERIRAAQKSNEKCEQVPV
jgi:hypothetical protein